MLALARWCSDHRRAVVALWIVILIAIFGGWRAAGSRYANNFSLGNTGSQHAADLLQQSFPVQSGDRDQIVFHTQSGVKAAAVRGRVTAMLTRVTRLPHVTQVISTCSARGPGRSRTGSTAACPGSRSNTTAPCPPRGPRSTTPSSAASHNV